MIATSASMPTGFPWHTFGDILLLRGGHNATVVMIGAALLGLAAGLVGAFALLRKRSLSADALSNGTLPGLAGAFLIAQWAGIPSSGAILLFGAALTGLLAMWSIELMTRHTRLSEDAAIGMALSVFFGAGVVLLSVIQSQGGAQGGLKGFIYGQAASMLPAEAMRTGGIALAVILATILLHKEFALVAFDEAFARVGGWRVSLIDALLLALVTLVTVAGLRTVGAILIVAMLIIPPASARLWTDRVSVLLTLSGIIGAFSAYVGVAISALAPRAPTGALIVLTAGAVFVVSLLAAPRRGLLAATLRRTSLRLQILQDHALRRISLAAPDQRHPAAHWTTALLLRARNYATIRNNALTLTPTGQARAQRVARNHKLWTQYLISRAEIAPSHVDWSVDQVEHVLSPELIAELERELALTEAHTP